MLILIIDNFSIAENEWKVNTKCKVENRNSE